MHQSYSPEYWWDADSWHLSSWYLDWFARPKFSLERRVCTCMFLQGSCPIWNPKIPCGSSERPHFNSSFPVPALPHSLRQLPNQLPVNVLRTLKNRNWAADDYPRVCGSCVSEEEARAWHTTTLVSDEDCRTQSFLTVQISYNFLLYVSAFMSHMCFCAAVESLLLLTVRLAFQAGATVILTDRVSEQRCHETGLYC